MCGNRQSIANTLYSDNKARTSRIVTEFLTQLSYQHAQIVGLILLGRPPYLAQYLLVGQNLPRMIGQKAQ